MMYDVTLFIDFPAPTYFDNLMPQDIPVGIHPSSITDQYHCTSEEELLEVPFSGSDIAVRLLLADIFNNAISGIIGIIIIRLNVKLMTNTATITLRKLQNR